MEGIYVISTIDQANENIYKIIKYTGPQIRLLKKYGTYLINPIIYYCYPCSNSLTIEKMFKDEFYKYQINYDNGNQPEWVCLELFEIIKYLNNNLGQLP